MKRRTEKEKWAVYGLNRPAKPRYVGLKGIYWFVTSLYVRIRDYKMWGCCIGCGKTVNSWRDLQGGHFINTKTCGFDLLFDLKNVNGECGGCNAYDKQKLGYERRLDERYGPGTALSLKDRFFEHKKIGKSGKEFSTLQYDKAIRERLGAIEMLGKYEI